MNIKGKLVQFSASRSSDLLAGGSGKTRMNYIWDLAEKKIGIDRDFRTRQMMHGINSEDDAILILTGIVGGSANKDLEGNQIYFPYNDFIGATPDAIGEGFVGDAKCQYNISNFIEQNDKLPTKYYIQLQCQMLALRVDKAYLINYLTKPEEWGDDEWQEYPFALPDRYFIHEVSRNEETINLLLQKSEEYFPFISLGAEMMESAIKLNDIEFFGYQMYEGVRFRKLKDTNWINNDSEVFRNGDEFYIKK